jgi:hypothetical protein
VALKRFKFNICFCFSILKEFEVEQFFSAVVFLDRGEHQRVADRGTLIWLSQNKKKPPKHRNPREKPFCLDIRSENRYLFQKIKKNQKKIKKIDTNSKKVVTMV